MTFQSTAEGTGLMNNSIHIQSTYTIQNTSKARKDTVHFPAVKIHEIEDIMNRFYNYETKEFDTKEQSENAGSNLDASKGKKFQKQKGRTAEKNQRGKASKEAKNQY